MTIDDLSPQAEGANMTTNRIRRNQFGRSRENQMRLQAVMDAAQETYGAKVGPLEPLFEEDVEDVMPRQAVPIRFPAHGEPSIVVKWCRGSSSGEEFHSFSLSYPAGMTGGLEARIHDGLEAAHWRYDPSPRWRTDGDVSGGLYWHDGDGREAFSELAFTLSTLVKDVFHTGDVPADLAGYISLHWKERSKQNYVRCIIGDGNLSEQRRYQLANVIERFDGFRNGQSVTFPQRHSGDIAADLRMVGFQVDETFSADEPHYVEISETWPIRIRGMIGDDAWSFEAKDSTWKIRIGGADQSTDTTWSQAGIRPSRPMAFEEAEQLITDAIDRYLSGGSQLSL
jgi:hypothetical protein